MNGYPQKSARLLRAGHLRDGKSPRKALRSE